MEISPKEKLRWLKEINEFIDKTLSSKQKEIRRKIREYGY